MTTTEKEQLHKHILQEIEAVKHIIASHKKSAKPVAPDNAIGRLSRMEAINSKSISEEALRKAQSSLAGLERALKMIDNPDFGYCVECGEEILFKRLMIMPGARMCVECAGKRG